MFQFAGSNQWHAFDAHATLFSDAQRLGWTTGVVGWYNPYCRILAGTLTTVFGGWATANRTEPISTKSSLENAVVPGRNIVRELEQKPSFAQRNACGRPVGDHAQAEALIRDQSIGFVFIHLAGAAPSRHLRP